MSAHQAPNPLTHVAAIVPALNEVHNLATLLPVLRALSLGQIIVCDNGSTDGTREMAEAKGADWVFEPRRGYGAACHAGLLRLAPSIEVVAFVDADLGDDAALLPSLVGPIIDDRYDFVVGSRVRKLREPGAMTLGQRVANRLFPILIKLGWGHEYTDLGPFRAIRRTSLTAIDMRDRAFGWTIEMQIRAVELGLRICEVPVPCRKRRGRSRISGTLRGVFLAAYWISRTCGVLWVTKRRRLSRCG